METGTGDEAPPLEVAKVVDKTKKKCFNCGELGHYATECQYILWCKICGEQGHCKNTCPDKKTVVAAKDDTEANKDKDEKESSTEEKQKKGKSESIPDQVQKSTSTSLDTSTTTNKDACFNCGQLGHKVKECKNESVCRNCGQKGHVKATCPNEKADLSAKNSSGADQPSFKQPEKTKLSKAYWLEKGLFQKSSCFKCGQMGHVVGDCPNKSLCKLCGDLGHSKKDCPNITNDGNKSQKTKMHCFNCGEMGHNASQCQYRLWCTICGESGHCKNTCPDKKTVMAAKGDTETNKDNSEKQGTNGEKQQETKSETIPVLVQGSTSGTSSGQGTSQQASNQPTKIQLTKQFWKEKGLFLKKCCYNCGRIGHIGAECQNESLCFLCGDHGHSRRQCPNLQNKEGDGTTSALKEQQKTRVPKAVWKSRGLFQAGGCFKCGKAGHIITNCRFKSLCKICGEVGHTYKECPIRGGTVTAGDNNTETKCVPIKQETEAVENMRINLKEKGLFKAGSCFNCGQKGHVGRNCRNQSLCKICGELGHILKNCQNLGRVAKDKNADKNLISREQETMQQHQPAEKNLFKSDKACFNCGQLGHALKACCNEAVCRNCLQHGHINTNCPNDKASKREKDGDNDPPQLKKRKLKVLPELADKGLFLSNLACFNCGQTGHRIEACKNKAVCRKCGQEGHNKLNCPKEMVAKLTQGISISNTGKVQISKPGKKQAGYMTNKIPTVTSRNKVGKVRDWNKPTNQRYASKLLARAKQTYASDQRQLQKAMFMQPMAASIQPQIAQNRQMANNRQFAMNEFRQPQMTEWQPQMNDNRHFAINEFRQLTMPEFRQSQLSKFRQPQMTDRHSQLSEFRQPQMSDNRQFQMSEFREPQMLSQQNESRNFQSGNFGHPHVAEFTHSQRFEMSHTPEMVRSVQCHTTEIRQYKMSDPHFSDYQQPEFKSPPMGEYAKPHSIEVERPWTESSQQQQRVGKTQVDRQKKILKQNKKFQPFKKSKPNRPRMSELIQMNEKISSRLKNIEKKDRVRKMKIQENFEGAGNQLKSILQNTESQLENSGQRSGSGQSYPRQNFESEMDGRFGLHEDRRGSKDFDFFGEHTERNLIRNEDFSDWDYNRRDHKYEESGALRNERQSFDRFRTPEPRDMEQRNKRKLSGSGFEMERKYNESPVRGYERRDKEVSISPDFRRNSRDYRQNLSESPDCGFDRGELEQESPGSIIKRIKQKHRENTIVYPDWWYEKKYRECIENVHLRNESIEREDSQSHHSLSMSPVTRPFFAGGYKQDHSPAFEQGYSKGNVLPTRRRDQMHSQSPDYRKLSDRGFENSFRSSSHERGYEQMSFDRNQPNEERIVKDNDLSDWKSELRAKERKALLEVENRRKQEEMEKLQGQPKDCPLPGCPVKVRNLKHHALNKHVPDIFRTVEKPDTVNQEELTPRRISALTSLKAAVLGPYGTLNELMDLINGIGIDVPAKEEDLTKCHSAMADVCRSQGWRVPPSFSLKPLNSPAALIHWRAQLVLLGLIDVKRRNKILSAFPPEGNIKKPKNIKRPNIDFSNSPVKKKFQKTCSQTSTSEGGSSKNLSNKPFSKLDHSSLTGSHQSSFEEDDYSSASRERYHDDYRKFSDNDFSPSKNSSDSTRRSGGESELLAIEYGHAHGIQGDTVPTSRHDRPFRENYHGQDSGVQHEHGTLSRAVPSARSYDLGLPTVYSAPSAHDIHNDRLDIINPQARHLQSNVNTYGINPQPQNVSQDVDPETVNQVLALLMVAAQRQQSM